MNTMTLGEKITYLVAEFHNNPQPFVAAFKSTCNFTNQFRDISIYGVDATADDFIEACQLGNVQICTGQINEKLKNERLYCTDIQLDLLMFAPRSSYSPHLYHRGAFGGSNEQFDNFLTRDYTEEEMFQYSTTLSNSTLETLETFKYLKVHCTIPFKINLSNVNLDEAIEVYKQWKA